MPHHVDGRAAKHVVLLVAQRLAGCDDDGVSGVDAEGIEVFHVAHRDAVVPGVAHHLVLHLLPPEHGLLHQNLRAHGEGLGAHVEQHLLVVADARAEAAQRVGRADHHRVADLTGRRHRLFHRVACEALGDLLADLADFVREELAILRILDDLDLCAQHLHTVLLEDARVVKLDAAVEGRLPAHGDDDAVRPLARDHLLYEVGRDGEEEDLVGLKLGLLADVGLNRGDVGVHEHHL
mmetsp:Transcript_69997/g.158249  ORF Transcript_69997/g.158249 Transcript_69997/m.158249 type:complete len:236 (+) Transcript_69997:2344-3051(+)